MGRGLLLINLGTPDSPNISRVSAYLRQFLTDKRVIDIPALLRYALVYCYIVPSRSKKTTLAYQSVWTQEGSPLLCFSQNMISQLRQLAGSDSKVALGMRYSTPSIKEALDSLKNCESITILPLYPQYSSAATGSSIEEALNIIASWEVIPSVAVIRDFYNHPGYINAQACIIKKSLGQIEHLLFSYHGLPERQLIKSGCNPTCTSICPPPINDRAGCYKAQCHQTSRLLAKALNLNTNQYSSSFQSRLGKLPWIKPYTDDVLIELAAKGIKNLAVACPSFVTDCLETLEEIGIHAKQQWKELGGESFTLIPCMNDDAIWMKAILELSHIHHKS